MPCSLLTPAAESCASTAAPDHDVPLDADGNNIYELVVQVSDGAATAIQTLAITADNRNEMPQGSDGRIGMAEDGSHRFTLADFGFRDNLDSAGNNLAAVQIVALPGQGLLQLAGRSVVAGECGSRRHRRRATHLPARARRQRQRLPPRCASGCVTTAAWPMVASTPRRAPTR